MRRRRHRGFAMGTIIEFHPSDEGVRVRPSNLSELTPLVSVFRYDRELLPFVRYLLNEHGIFSVRDWDSAPLKVFDGFSLAEELKARFKNRLGRPVRKPVAGGAHIMPIRHVYRPA